MQISKPNPLVSIVLPTYNGSRFIATSIESCLEQTHQNIELIIVDGGSTDKTLEIVRNFTDPRIKIIHQRDNTGLLPGALNEGFAQATGEYFTWTQDDDYFTPDAIEVMLTHLQNHPDVGMVYAGFWFINGQGEITHESRIGPPEDLFWTNPIGHCFLYRREVAARVGEYDVGYLMSEDSHYWMRIYRCAKIALIPGRYYFHRLHSESLTVKDYGQYWAMRVSARARRTVLGLNWIAYQRQVAAVFIEEAFAAYSNRAFDRVRHCLARGLLRNPVWLGNRGVLSIGLESLIGSKIMQAYRRH